MAYSTLSTVNPGDTLSSSTWGNQVKNNEETLYSGRPGSVVRLDNNANITTTSTSYVDVHASLAITLTIGSGKVRLSFIGMTAPGASGDFDFTVDGTRIGTSGADGLVGTSTAVNMAATHVGLSAGSHTFKVQWKKTSGTLTLYSGNGVAGQDYIPVFAVEEVG